MKSPRQSPHSLLTSSSTPTYCKCFIKWWIHFWKTVFFFQNGSVARVSERLLFLSQKTKQCGAIYAFQENEFYEFPFVPSPHNLSLNAAGGQSRTSTIGKLYFAILAPGNAVSTSQTQWSLYGWFTWSSVQMQISGKGAALEICTDPTHVCLVPFDEARIIHLRNVGLHCNPWVNSHRTSTCTKNVCTPMCAIPVIKYRLCLKETSFCPKLLLFRIRDLLFSSRADRVVL